MRMKARTDKGHKAIVQALRKVGCKVKDTSGVGRGFPDLVVRIAGRGYTMRAIAPIRGHGNYQWEGAAIVLMEIKEPKGKLTPDQEQFLAEWPETVIVRSVEEALAAVGVR